AAGGGAAGAGARPRPPPPRGTPAPATGPATGPATQLPALPALPANGNGVPPNGSAIPPFAPGNGDCGAGGCGNGYGACLADTGRAPYQFYASGEFLLWRISDANLPSTSANVPVGVLHFQGTDTFNPGSPPPGTLPPNTVTPLDVPVLIRVNRENAEGPKTNLGEHTGGRVTLGGWLNECHDWGLEVSGFWLPTRTQTFNNTTGLSPDIINFNTGLSNNQFLVTGGTPGATAGIQPTTILLSSVPVLFVRSTTATVLGEYDSKAWGFELNGRHTYAWVGPVECGALVGVRYVNLEEGITLSDSISLTRQPSDSTTDTLPAVINFNTVDSIRTRNQFYGAQVGLDFDGQAGPVFLTARAKIALGGNRQSADVTSFTLSSISGVT